MFFFFVFFFFSFLGNKTEFEKILPKEKEKGKEKKNEALATSYS